MSEQLENALKASQAQTFATAVEVGHLKDEIERLRVALEKIKHKAGLEQVHVQLWCIADAALKQD